MGSGIKGKECKTTGGITKRAQVENKEDIGLLCLFITSMSLYTMSLGKYTRPPFQSIA